MNSGWIDTAGFFVNHMTNLTEFSASMIVPDNPLQLGDEDGPVLYWFIGAEDGAPTILQPVLGYVFGVWTFTSWICWYDLLTSLLAFNR